MNLAGRLAVLAQETPDALALVGPGGVTYSRTALLDRAAAAAPTIAVTDDDPVTALTGLLAAQARGEAFLDLPTSGSTAAPRRVRRTVESWMASLPVFDVITGLCAEDVVWAPGSPRSTLTLYACWQALAAGVPVIADGPWHGRAPWLERFGPTIVQCAAPLLGRILADPPPTLRRAVVAGAPLPAAVLARSRSAGIEVVEYYGAAELSFVAVDLDGTGLRPFPGVQVDVRGDVLWARSAYLCHGYTDRPGRGIGATPGPLRRDSEGWATVGDRAEIVDGVIRLLGRPDAATVAGHTVHLADVEAALRDVPGVIEVVCLAEPEATTGERVMAVLLGDPEVADLPQRVRRAARSRLAPAARPTRVVVVAEFPRTPGGKPDRARLAEQLTGRRGVRAGGSDRP